MLENVLIPAMAERSPSAEAVERAKYLLGALDWPSGWNIDRRSFPAASGSGRVSRGRYCLSRQLVLADEPTGNLDRKSAAAIGELLIEMQREEQTMLLVVTHSLELAQRFERRYEIDDGQMKDA